MSEITLINIKNLLTETFAVERDGIKQLLDTMESRLRGEMQEIRQELSQEIQDEIGGLRQEVRDGFQAVGEAIVRIHDDIDEHGHRISRLEKGQRRLRLQSPNSL